MDDRTMFSGWSGIPWWLLIGHTRPAHAFLTSLAEVVFVSHGRPHGHGDRVSVVPLLCGSPHEDSDIVSPQCLSKC